MNKILIGISIIVLVAVGWFLFQGDTVDYVSEVNDEVTALETELAEIDAAVQAGTFTPEEATKAQARIVARIDAINDVATSGQRAQLTDAQKAQLASGLQRLAGALTRYKTTLEAVDEAVLELPESQRPQLRQGGGGGSRGVVAIANETVIEVDNQIDEIIEDITDEELATEIASSTDDVQMDDVATSTEETTDSVGNTDETGTEVEESVESDETTDSDLGSEEKNSTEDDITVSVDAEGGSENGEETTNQ